MMHLKKMDLLKQTGWLALKVEQESFRVKMYYFPSNNAISEIALLLGK
jgi:hypothetical protein